MKLNKLKIATLICTCALTAGGQVNAENISNFSQLQTAINNSVSSISILNDITMTGEIKIPASASINMYAESTGFSLISDGNAHKAFDFANGTALTIDNIDFKDFKFSTNGTSTSGAVINNSGNLTVQNSSFTNNSATNTESVAGYGGAIVASAGSFVSANNTYESNSARQGGAVAINEVAVATISGDSYLTNSSKAAGGAIANGGNTTIKNSKFVQNYATGTAYTGSNPNSGDGGAIVNNGLLTINGDLSLFEDNLAYKSGGAIASEQGKVIISDKIEFTANKSLNATLYGGGAIYNAVNSEFNLGTVDQNVNASFYKNSSTLDGGAIYNIGTMYMEGKSVFGKSTDSTFGNIATNNGGAIYNIGTFTLRGEADFYYNQAINGGALYNAENSTINLVGTALFNNNTATANGGAINSAGTLIFDGVTEFKGNTAVVGGAIYNTSDLTISGTSEFSDNKATTTTAGGGAICNVGSISILGTYSDTGVPSIVFSKNSSGYDAGAILVQGSSSKKAFMNISGVAFTENAAQGRGGALRGGSYSVMNITDSKFVGNTSKTYGGAFSSTDSSNIYVSNSYFQGNGAGISGGVLTNGSNLTVANSTFLDNYVVKGGGKGEGGGAISYNGTGTFKLVADAADTYFSGNYISNKLEDGRVKIKSQALNFYENTSGKIYFNAGNGGSIIFDDMVYTSKTGMWDINLNSSVDESNNPLKYSSYEAISAKTTDDLVAPTDGKIIFNNQVQNANLILNNGTLVIAEDPTKLESLYSGYFSNSAITLNGGTLDLLNKNIESSNALLLSNGLIVNNDANIELDVDLANHKIDCLGTTIKGATGATLTISDLGFSGTQVESVGYTVNYQFVTQNGTSTNAGVNVSLVNNLKTVITSEAGFSLDLIKQNSAGTNDDTLAITKVVDAGGLPVAVSIGSDFSDATYVYTATADEDVTNWNKNYSIYKDGNVYSRTASNVLKGTSLVINGNGYTVITSTVGLQGIQMTTDQELTINNVDNWSNFSSAVINNGGKLNLNNSSFSNNTNGAIKNSNGGTVNIVDTNFTNNANGAIISDGATSTVNISASALKTVTMNNNGTSDLVVNDGGTVNLQALGSTSSITLNGQITGDSSSLANINITNTNLGNVIFNNTVSNSNVTLNNGTLQIGNDTTKLTGSNYFDNVNLTLSDGTLDLRNGQIDNINVSDLTINNTPSILLDVDLSANNQSDKLTVSGNVTGDGTIGVGSLNLIGTMGSGVSSIVAEFVSQAVSSSIKVENQTITFGGEIYVVGVNNNLLTITKQGSTSGYAATVIEQSLVKTFQISAVDEIVSTWIDGDNKLYGNDFTITGGNNNKSIIGAGIIGVEVSSGQKVTINNVSGYNGFDSAFINNGGTLSATSSTFNGNNATTGYGTVVKDANGGVFQNNSGTITISNGVNFTNNTATGNGGAIYNNATLNLKPSLGSNITFSGNTANSLPNDIYQTTNGVTNISSYTGGSITLNGGFAGGGQIINSSAADNVSTALVLATGSDSSSYTGTYSQTGAAVLTANSGSKFFGGTTTISSGTLNWNTNEALANNASLIVSAGQLNIGDSTNSANLTISGTSNISGTENIAINNNGTLTLKKDTTLTGSSVSGDGALIVDGTTLTLNAGSNLSGIDFVSKVNLTDIDPIVDIVSNSDNVDSILTTIKNGTNSSLTVVLEGSNSNTDLTLDNTNIDYLVLKGSQTLAGELVNSAYGTNKGILNQGNLAVTGDIKNDGSLINSSTLDISGDVVVTGSGDNATINNSGTVNLSGNVSGYSGNYTQTAGTTNVLVDGKVFGGQKYINVGALNISSADNIDYTNVHLGNNATLTHTATSTKGGTISSSVVNFQSGASGATATFGTSSGVVANYVLADKIDNGSANTVSVSNANLSLGATDFTGETVYNINNTTLSLVESAGTLSNYEFTNLTTSGVNKLSINANFVDTSDPNVKAIATDTLKVGTSGNAQFSVGQVYISGNENGQSLYSTTQNVLSGNATFTSASASEVVANGATTAYEYKVQVPSANNQTIEIKAIGIANENSLYKINALEGNRFFQFSVGQVGEYHIDQSLSATKQGDFYVSGKSNVASDCVLSGLLYDTTTHQPSGGNGSFFNIASGVTTNLSISDLTVQDAVKSGSGSVVENNSATSVVTMGNVIVQNNTATGNGGAIYNNAGTLTVNNSTFKGNSSVNGGVAGLGGAIYNNGTMNLTNVTVNAATSNTILNDIYQGADGSTLLSGTNTINSNISGLGTITNQGILNLGADNSGYTGAYNQTTGTTNVNSGSKFFDGTSTINNGILNWNTANDLVGALVVNDGNLNIGNVTSGSILTLGASSSVANVVKTNIASGSTLGINGANVTLNNNDVWAGQVKVTNGSLIVDNVANNGILNATGGSVNLADGNLNLGTDSQITNAVATTIGADTNLNITGGDVTVGSDDTWTGNVNLNSGKLTVDGTTSNGKIVANGGDLDITSGTLKVGNGSLIADAVKTTINTNGTIDIIDNGTVTIGNNDVWDGIVSLNGGVLNYGTTNSGTLSANTGNLNLLSGSVLNIQTPSQVEDAVVVDIQTGSTVNITNGAGFNLDNNDKWNGMITNSGTTGGTLTTTGLVNNTGTGGGLQQSSGTSIFKDNSHIYLNGTNSYISGGDVSVLNNSSLSLGANTQSFVAENLGLGGNSSFNILNGVIDSVTTENMAVNGSNYATVDLNVRDKVGDTFVINNLVGTSNGSLSISDFNFVGGAPLDREVKFQIFDADTISNVAFGATDKAIATPIGNYQLFSQGGGAYSAMLTSYNSQVFRGQVATMSMYNNQINIDDIVLSHISLTSERTLAQGLNSNKYAAVNPLFAPYQYTKEEGGLWYKSYVDIERLSMTQGLNVHNTAYGSLMGADLPLVHLKHGWDFIGTPYIGYNGSTQDFSDVRMYQNGGQAGFMGTFMKNDFIGSATIYGGGYNNEMQVAGYTENTGNWFAGTATKLAYNLHASKHFTIQPTAFVSYNIFGKQHWQSDYGIMGMNSGLLNGVNVAPGVNFIYSRDSWSVYATAQYMYNINDNISGGAGNIDLPSIKMRHGYLQYGVGATKTWKERLSAYFQVVLRNGGRTGIGFQLGCQYLFDFPWSKQKIKTKTTPTGQKKIIKSISKVSNMFKSLVKFA